MLLFLMTIVKALHLASFHKSADALISLINDDALRLSSSSHIDLSVAFCIQEENNNIETLINYEQTHSTTRNMHLICPIIHT